MSSYYQYFYNRPEYEGLLDFIGDTVSVTNNVVARSNISCDTLMCSNILQSNLISTSIYASNNIRVASNIQIGNASTNSNVRLSIYDNSLIPNNAMSLVIGQGPNPLFNGSLNYFRATNSLFNVTTLSCGVNNLQLYAGATAFNGGSYSVLNSQLIAASNVFMRSNVKIGYGADLTASAFNCDVNGSLNVTSNIVCSNLQITGSTSFKTLYVQDLFNTEISTIFRSRIGVEGFLCSKNQVITNKLLWSSVLGQYDPLVYTGSNPSLTDLTTIIDTDGKIPFSVIKDFDDGLGIASIVLSSLAALLGLGAIGLSAWSTFFSPTVTGGIGPPGAEGPQGDQGAQGNPGVGVSSISIVGTNFKFTLSDASIINVPIPYDAFFTTPQFNENVLRVIASTSLEGPVYDVGNIRERGVESIRSTINTVRNTAQTAATTVQNTVRNGARAPGRAVAGFLRSIANPAFEANNAAQSSSIINAINIIAPG